MAQETTNKKDSGEKPGQQEAASARPHIKSPWGILMLALAVLLESMNALFGLADLGLPGIHALFAPIINGIGVLTIGTWIFFRTGASPVKKLTRGLLPLALNSIPIPIIGGLIGLIPYWIWSVWSSLEK